MAIASRTIHGAPLICAGSPREMGIAQGSAVRPLILQAMEVCLKDPSFRQGYPWYIPTWFLLWAGKRRAARLLAEPLKRDFARMHERLCGMSEGSKLDLRLTYFCNAYEAMLASVSDRSAVPPACSAVAVRGKLSATGDIMVARNFDYVPIIQPFLIVREDRPTGGYRSFQFSVATSASAFDGLNECGLCITYNYGHTVDEAPPTGTVSMLISEALERCKSVNEAAELISKRPRWGGAILMLADARGDMASLEISSTRTRLRRPSAGDDFLCHTNCFHTTEMRQVQAPDSAVFTEAAHESLRGHRVLESAEVRYARLTQLLGRSAALSLEQLMAIMSDHGADNCPSQTTICVHGGYAKTIATANFQPRQRKMRVDFTSACQAQCIEMSF